MRHTIAVVGDRGVREGSRNYDLAREVGRAACERGYRVLTGGLSGVMEAASRGARESPAWTDGTVIAILPGLDAGAANAFADIAVPTALGHLRNGLVAQADAVIAVGGGAGTLSEVAFAWIYNRLIVALRDADGWSAKLADTRVDHRTRVPHVPDDRVFGATTADEALDLVDARLPSYLRRLKVNYPP